MEYTAQKIDAPVIWKIEMSMIGMLCSVVARSRACAHLFSFDKTIFLTGREYGNPYKSTFSILPQLDAITKAIQLSSGLKKRLNMKYFSQQYFLC